MTVNHTRILTAKQHIKYIPNIDPLGTPESKSGIHSEIGRVCK